VGTQLAKVDAILSAKARAATDDSHVYASKNLVENLGHSTFPLTPVAFEPTAHCAKSHL
jgi:hypothetical protein